MFEVAIAFGIIYLIVLIFLFLTPIYYMYVVKASFKYIGKALRIYSVIALVVIAFNMLLYFTTKPTVQASGIFYQGDGIQFLGLGILYFYLPFIYLQVVKKKNPPPKVFVFLFLVSFSLFNYQYYPQWDLIQKNQAIQQNLMRGNVTESAKKLNGDCIDYNDIEHVYYRNNELMDTLDEKAIAFLIQCYKTKSEGRVYDSYALFSYELKRAEKNQKILNLFVSDQFFDNFSSEDKIKFAQTITYFLATETPYLGGFDEYIEKIEFILSKRPSFIKYLGLGEDNFWWSIRLGNTKYANYIEKHIQKKSVLMQLTLDIINHNDSDVIKKINQNQSLLNQPSSDFSFKKVCKDFNPAMDSNMLIFWRGTDNLIAYILDNNLVNLSNYQCKAEIFDSVNRKSNYECVNYLVAYLKDNENISDKDNLIKKIKITTDNGCLF